MTLVTVFALLLSYLLGSIPAAAWVARARGVDIRTVGSGNSGATNVLRSVGRGPALAVAVFDILKGALAVVIARALGLDPLWSALCGLAAVIGHNYSPFLGFRGGKGVATSFGTLAVIDPVVGACAFVLGIFTMWLTRFVSAGSIIAAVAAGLLVMVMQRPIWMTVIVLLLAGQLVWLHRANITRLHEGTERRLGEKVK
ncbi:glycerol-3-phosphate acyltransferase PlsY [Deinococcus metalli]|uniref:Glycerol-3-phosphate acyltransferase n=1 Tax=Deinococcus metalli TaxID=1141878 RepID=A0A7W8KJY3_9DEIO|nr:glycerol-3-phosphate 1-O-acyltransferase PlsY [Deinococcus metalli]MBB5377909.1 glycerol-3-phosphate acyltransferase PlsY [Deinococcus metalli]GHF55168.1 glycerol-3-phosphate acyltransferase 1 [Deinococcus metalli]